MSKLDTWFTASKLNIKQCETNMSKKYAAVASNMPINADDIC